MSTPQERYQDCLQSTLVACLRSWKNLPGRPSVLGAVNMTTTREHYTCLQETHPHPAGDRVARMLLVEGTQVNVSLSENHDPDVVWIQHGSLFSQWYVSDLEAGLHEIYNQLRRDGVSPEAARESTLLLGEDPTTRPDP